MKKDEALDMAYANPGQMYTCDALWEDNENYVSVDRRGYLSYANGEEVIDEDELPEDDWFDVTDYDQDADWEPNYPSHINCYNDDIMYDEENEDMY